MQPAVSSPLAHASIGGTEVACYWKRRKPPTCLIGWILVVDIICIKGYPFCGCAEFQLLKFMLGLEEEPPCFWLVFTLSFPGVRGPFLGRPPCLDRPKLLDFLAAPGFRPAEAFVTFARRKDAEIALRLQYFPDAEDGAVVGMPTPVSELGSGRDSQEQFSGTSPGVMIISLSPI